LFLKILNFFADFHPASTETRDEKYLETTFKVKWRTNFCAELTFWETESEQVTIWKNDQEVERENDHAANSWNTYKIDTFLSAGSYTFKVTKAKNKLLTGDFRLCSPKGRFLCFLIAIEFIKYFTAAVEVAAEKRGQGEINFCLLTSTQPFQNTASRITQNQKGNKMLYH